MINLVIFFVILTVSFFKYFPQQAALNINLKLVIVYCDDTFIKDLIVFLIKRKLSLHVILITYNYSTIYKKGYYNGDIQSINFFKLIKNEDIITVQRLETNKCDAFEASFNIHSI